MDANASDYTVVPLPLFDANLSNTNIIGRVGVIFDAPLSFDKLQESWYQTLQVRPIMQARVRRSTTAPSGLEYHVLTPQGMAKYMESQRMAPDHLKDFYCLDESHRSITDHCAGFGVGPSAPSHSYRTFVTDCADSEEEKRCMAFNGVQKFDEILDTDRPILTIQVTRFCDATLVTISVSHIIGDLFTIKSLYKGWESTLHGKLPPPFERLGHDPFSAYGPGGEHVGDINSKSPSMPLGWHIYGLLDKARLMPRFLWDYHVSRPEKTISQKYVFIAEAEVQALEEQAKQDVADLERQRKEKGINATRPLTVTRSNVLFAWLLKNNHTHLGPDEWSRPITIVNTRFRPPTGLKPQPKGDDFPKDNWYGGAMAVAIPSLKVGKLLSMPLGDLALHIQDGIRESSTPENTRRFLAFILHNSLWKKPSGKLALFHPPTHRASGLLDWRLIQLQDIEFTPARLDGGNQSVVVCGFNCHLLTTETQRDCWVCMGQAGGGVWFLGMAGENQWRDPKGFGKYPYLQRRASKL